MKQFEYVIAGAGAAGLTLAYLLVNGQNSKKSIAIIDKAGKSTNDRTWCFWEKGPNLLENLVYKSWEKGHFESDTFTKTYDLTPYRYKMIRGIDFYQFMREHLQAHGNVQWIQDEIKSVSADGEVQLSQEVIAGKIVFDSTRHFQSFQNLDQYTTLLQHFKGYFLKTKKPVFDPDTFTYMGLNIPQEGDFRFGYVLPFSETNALVEYTIFNTYMLEDEVYDQRVKSYIKDNLGIEEYEVYEEEFGVIPMSDYPFPFKISDHHYHIGISGGFAKASTGYTFLRSQKILAQLVKNLENNKPLLGQLPYRQKRFKKYDSTLLKVLAKEDNVGRQAFSDMFEKNGMHKMFRFLDEETSLGEELAIMGSTPLLTFGKAFMRSMVRG